MPLRSKFYNACATKLTASPSTIPGIGPQRKLTLLQTFGSVYRLARAPLADIAAVPGIGPELAAAILRAVGGTHHPSDPSDPSNPSDPSD